MGAWTGLWALGALHAVAAAPAPSAPRVVSVLEKVRPGAAPAGAAEARVSLARGECEGVQVWVPGGDAALLAAAPLTLRGPAGAVLPVTLLREAYLEVKTPSNSEGAAGAWPDALLPLSAPEPKPGAAPRVLYAELCAPATQTPGTYRGELALGKAGTPGAARVPFTAEVQPFAIPATSSLPNSFGISLYSIARGHGLAPESPEAHQLLAEYARAMLAHRVSPHGLSMEAPPVHFEEGRARVDFRAYDAEVGPLLDGSALPSGARATTAELRDSRQAKTDAEKAAYYRAFAEHFREKGWTAQLFFYAKDEPRPEDAALVRAQAARVRAASAPEQPSARSAATRVPVLVTAPLDEAFRSSADILAPTLNCFFPRPGPQTCRNVVPLASLRARLAPGTRVWWYQSCNSQGCTGGPAADPAIERVYRGWASYMVDHPAVLNRAMGPLAFATGVDGELYFDTVFAYNTKDPWQDLFEFGGNGDGTLFYPGTPAHLGTARHAPVVSLRLKHLRDGLEDYEYLRLLTQLGEGEFARACVQRLARSGYDIEHDPAVWEQVRRDMTARLRARWARSRLADRASAPP
ncbi:DUF4091 domain-containing protein [Aggregicoccus sp. 17bor-14]|uniref:DUF4091 domain-containing protein n=1 Tax=Myxococcaceae TaxID=31 RepID=UPI00129CA0FF|nr:MULTISPECIES: DUF4091 domain-containing protein [Myxococcaceae]MBF5041455.1 DUF4091 domain-containing protein [Simulacricoccus sp. 17bor-14]MRI87239.1 DUF4091 domain-containing protein [Aggregicoccus sp. 17bor-14]